MFLNEIRKYRGARWLLFLLAGLMLASFLVCWFVLKEDGIKKYGKDADKTFAEMVSYYSENDEEREELRKSSAEQSNALFAQVLNEWMEEKEASGLGDAYPPLDMENIGEKTCTYLNGSSIPDSVILGAIDSKEQYATTLFESIETVLDQARRNAARLEAEGASGGMDDDLYYYQAKVYNTYKPLAESIQIENEPVIGWQELFEYSYSDVFLFFSLLLFACGVFLPEKDAGMLPLLSVCKKGRLHLRLTKTVFVIVGAILLALIFEGLTVLSVYLTSGFSDPHADIQNISTFMLYPEKTLILGYFVYSVVMKVLASVAFALIVAAVSSLTYNTLVTFLSGAVLLGGSFAFNTLKANTHPILRCFNFFSAAHPQTLSERLHVLQPFHKCYPYTVAVPVFFALLIVLSASICVFVSVRVNIGKTKVPLKKIVRSILDKIENRLQTLTVRKRKKPDHKGLFVWETRKQLWNNRPVLILVLLLLAAQITVSIVTVVTREPSRAYHAYSLYLLSETEGPYSEQGEKNERLLSLYQNIDRAQKQLRSDYKSGDYDKETYERISEYLSKIDERKLQEEFRYAKELNDIYKSMEADGKDPWIIDYLPYEHLFSDGMPYFLYAAILVICVGAFVKEYSGKSKNDRFAVILRAAKNGRGKIFYVKFASSLVLSGGLMLAFTAAEFLPLLMKESFTAWSAPLCSLPSFADAGGTITILQYTIIFFVVRIISALIFAVFVTALSQITKNLLFCLASAVGVTLIPTLLYSFGLSGAGYLSFGDFFSVNGMARFSVKQQMFENDFGVLIIYGSAFAAVTLALTLFARRRFVK